MYRVVFAVAAALLLSLCVSTPLDDYVNTYEPLYSYTIASKVSLDAADFIVLNMTSQQWRPHDLINQTTWYHYVSIIVPKGSVASTALLMITGGSNGNKIPSPDPILLQIAVATRTVTAAIQQIPNQPLFFRSDSPTRKRVEDQIIALAWRNFIEGGAKDPLWLPRLPMVKASVMAMNATQDVLKKLNSANVEKFVVVGASKRGWTTWLTAAVDKRVVGFAPIVIDVLNLRKNIKHIYENYCFYPPALTDYVNEHIFDYQDTPEFDAMASIIDPLVYNDRFEGRPKLVVSAAGDQFFPTDSSLYGYAALAEPKLMRYVPNADHSLSGSDAFFSIASFLTLVSSGTPLPKISWTMNVVDKVAQLDVVAETAQLLFPDTMLLWQAHNNKTRDFRVEAVGRIWQSSPLQSQANSTHTTWSAQIPIPAEGYVGFFAEFEYSSKLPIPLKATTNAYVLPDVLPCKQK